MNGPLNRSTMSKNSRPMTPDASGDRLNAADFDKILSDVQVHCKTEAKDVESGDETRSQESNGSETSEHFCTSEIGKLFDMSDSQDVTIDSHSDGDDQGDIQDVCEKDEEQGLSQLHLAAERGDTEAVRNLLISSDNVDVLDTKH